MIISLMGTWERSDETNRRVREGTPWIRVSCILHGERTVANVQIPLIATHVAAFVCHSLSYLFSVKFLHECVVVGVLCEARCCWKNLVAITLSFNSLILYSYSPISQAQVRTNMALPAPAPYATVDEEADFSQALEWIGFSNQGNRNAIMSDGFETFAEMNSTTGAEIRICPQVFRGAIQQL